MSGEKKRVVNHLTHTNYKCKKKFKTYFVNHKALSHHTMFAVIEGPPEKPINITILSKTHNSITVGWTAGLNGGSEQQFKILYKENGQENWKENQDSISGIKTGKSINYSITGLDAEKEYKITVMAINQFQGRSESLADAQAVFTEGKV